VERRLTSVLFADLVGYTRISESRDTEEVRELLSAYFDTCQTVIKRYGGTVEKFIGDAVMAVWGVPVSHEDDAARSVRAGLELVTEVTALGERVGVSELALRVGVLTGEVSASLAAGNQGLVAGDPVNTAARIQSAAPAGQVWVDPETRALTSAEVRYEDVGEHSLKGKAEPLRLFRAVEVVAGRDGAQRVDGLEAPLVGRERELRLLKELFHATEESGRSQVVILDGEAGVGKSRLGWEFEKYVDGLSRTVRWHRGRCLSYGEGVAFWALAEAIRGRLGLVEEDAGTLTLAALDTLLESNVVDEQERSWLRPRVASLLGEESREFAREDLFAAWTRLFDRIGGENPVVLLIEDAQHADDGLIGFLEHLVANGRAGCFVVLLARPELLDERPQLGGRRATPIRIEPLSESAMSELVGGLVDGLPEEVAAALVTRAEGIPLYAVETVRALIDRDLVVPLEGRYVVAPGATLDLEAVGAPASLHALVAARLDALEPAERRVVSDASVLGTTFTREGIGILAADVPDLEAVLASLTRKELIGTESDRFSAERGQYRFVQSVVRQVAYSTLSHKDRRTRHLHVAEHLARDTDRADELAQVVARHLLDAAEASSADSSDIATLRSRAGELLVRAGERASNLGSHTDAARLFLEALECLADPVDRASAMLLRVRSLHLLSQFKTCEVLAREARTLYLQEGDVVGAAEAGFAEATAIAFMNRYDEALELGRSCYAELGSREDRAARRARGRLALQIGRALVWTGRFAEAHEHLMEALELSDGCGDEETFRRACNVLAVEVNRLGGLRVSQMILRGLAELSLAAEDWLHLSVALTNEAAISAPTDVQGALRSTLEANEVSREHGMPPESVNFANTLTYSWLTGEWDGVETVMEELADFVTDRPAAHFHGVAISHLCTWAGRPVRAPAIALVDSDGPDRVPYLLAEAGMRLSHGDPAGALTYLRDAVATEMRFNGLGEDLHSFWALAARLALDLDDRQAIEELRDLPGLREHAAMSGHVRVVDALVELTVPDHDVAAVEAELRAGIARLDATGHVVWAAHAREDLGRLLLEQGRPEEGGSLLAQARSAYEAMGARAWVTRVDALTAVPA
jgi:class 3 adenylate cyclase/tetratricopeptide (TPR) repeat protein